MFALIAAIVFATALSLAIGTMAFMFATYHDKMMAALLYKPAADAPPVYHVAVRHSRPRPLATLRLTGNTHAAPVPLALAA